MTDALKLKLSLLPDSPGCYLFKQQGQVLYVGKAKNLANRVRSYFRGGPHSAKVMALVARVDDLDTILCASNLEALILENNLIKKHKPYYNIALKDDKQYPYLRIHPGEPFAKLSIVRSAGDDGALYFGPYQGATSLRKTLDTLRRAFPLRSCNKKLPQAKPSRPCVNHEIGQCLAPCAHLVSQEDYQKVVDELIQFLRGKDGPVRARLTAQMQEAARNLQFERAQEILQSLRGVEALFQQQNAARVSGLDQDVLALAQDGLDAQAQALLIRGGQMIGALSYALPGEGDTPPKELMAQFLSRFYEERLPAREVICQEPDDRENIALWLAQRRGGAVDLTVPQRGTKKKLLDNAVGNARDALMTFKARETQRYERTQGAAQALAEALGLPDVPRRIEGFDISNTQGSLSVASMVVFVDGKPDKKEYRSFKIKTVVGANDFASMHEVLSRRFARVRDDKAPWPLPDLVLVDGGPEQLRFALDAMEKQGFSVPMVGLAERFEELYLPGQKEPLRLDRRSAALHLVERVRDEAHRFAITHHRKRRDKALTGSLLEQLPGVGPGRRRALLAHFRTMRAIGEATVDELAAVKGMNRPAAEAVYAAYRQPDEGNGTNQAPGSFDN